MKTLYHGSYITVSAPLAKAGRRNLDFGQGFYLTQIMEQAQEWAVIIAGRKGRNVTPVVNSYTFDDVSAKEDGVRFKIFDSYDIEWLDFIVSSRNGEKPWQGYDLIEGGIANDHVIDTIEAYMNGYMTIEMALGQLARHRPNNQICLLNQNLIDDCLFFKNVELLTT